MVEARAPTGAQQLDDDAAEPQLAPCGEQRRARSPRSRRCPRRAARDVTDNAAFTAFLDAVEQQLGLIDVLMNNAGMMPTGLIEDEPEHVTDRHIALNLGAVVHGTREAVKRMRPRGAGHIVNVSSAAGKNAVAQAATSSASKFAVSGIS